MEKKVLNTLGCTGGIGSGKTYVCTIFNKLGYPVYNSDERAKNLYDTDKTLLRELVKLLGNEIITDSKLNKKIMASKIFSDAKLLEEVENIVHPAVLRDFSKWKLELEQNNNDFSFVIFESAILLEKPIVKKIADRVLSISAPLDLRIERVMGRDKISKDLVMQRLSKQWSDNQRELMSDFIIFADSKHALVPQVVKVIDQMNNLKL